MKSIFIRNFIAIAIVVTFCFLILGGAVTGIGRGYMIDEYSEDMDRSALGVAKAAYAVYDSEGLSGWALGMLLSSISDATGNMIFVADNTGVILQCSEGLPVCEHTDVQIPEYILSPLRASGELKQISTLDGIFATQRVVVARNITDKEGNILGHVLVSCGIDNMLEAWHKILKVCAMVAIAVFVAALGVSMAYSKKMAAPLDEMAAASAKFARGDFSVRVKQEEDPSEEMGSLIESFNHMADSLEKAEERRSEFISNVSHELRTPMTTISGFADGILDGTIPPEEERKYLVAIRDETKRLTRLVRDMLDVSQLHSKAADKSRRSDFDLTELTLQTLLSFESRAMAKELDVDPQIPDGNIMVLADKDAITRVIYNLLDNAIKFAHNGTCITLKLYRDDEKAYVSIKDEGETIPAEDLPFIFDRFHKSDRSRSLDKEGVGLGLYLVKSIITGHDQDIAVKSESGVTEFVFTLQLSEKIGKQRE